MCLIRSCKPLHWTNVSTSMTEAQQWPSPGQIFEAIFLKASSLLCFIVLDDLKNLQIFFLFKGIVVNGELLDLTVSFFKSSFIGSGNMSCVKRSRQLLLFCFFHISFCQVFIHLYGWKLLHFQRVSIWSMFLYSSFPFYFETK